MRDQSKHSIEKFRSIMTDVNGVPTDKIVEALDRQDYWDKDELACVELDYKRTHVRKMLGRVCNDDGQRLFINLAVADSAGRRSRVYKNRDKMSVDEYKQAVEAYCRRGAQGFAAAKALVRDCKTLHNVQLRLPLRA